jgi:hypothetical protein
LNTNEDNWKNLAENFFESVLKSDDENWHVAQQFFGSIIATLAAESDRGRILLVMSWIDWFLQLKISNEFRRGNSSARDKLFAAGGPFGSLSNKLTTAFCAGWIDRDVYHDIDVLRKLRNTAAHRIEPASPNDDATLKLIQSFQVPHRHYHDWGALQEAQVFELMGHDRVGDVNLMVALPLIFYVLVCNLGIPIKVEGDHSTFVLKLVPHLELPDSDADHFADKVAGLRIYDPAQSAHS